MATYQIAYKASTKEVKIQNSGAALGAGFANIGTFDHDADPDDNLGVDANHVYWHHVRDKLYAQGVLDMQSVTIKVPVVSIDVTPATQTLDISNGDTVQLATAFTPPIARNQALTFVSSDPTKATVDANGKVRPVAAGSATITVTSVDTGVTDTCVVTVQA